MAYSGGTCTSMASGGCCNPTWAGLRMRKMRRNLFIVHICTWQSQGHKEWKIHCVLKSRSCCEWALGPWWRWRYVKLSLSSNSCVWMFEKLWWKGSHDYCQHFDIIIFSTLKNCILRIITNGKIVFSSKVTPIERKRLGLLKKKNGWLVACGPPNESFNFSHWLDMRRYASRDEMQNGLEQKNFSMPFYGVNWVTQVPHIESLLFLQTTARSVVFLILGTLYTSRISILWVFPGLTSHWWPISSYHKGELLFYTSDVEIVKFLAKKSIYSLVNIELQKYYQIWGKYNAWFW